MNIVRKVLLSVLLAVAFCGCSNAAEKEGELPIFIGKGEQKAMKTYYIGRFAIDLPEEFTLEMQCQRIRYAEVSDFRWESSDRGKEREVLWSQKIAEIKNLPKPADKKVVLLEEMNWPSIGKWAKGALYYGDYLNPRRLFYTILVDYGESGVWLTIGGTNKDKMVNNFSNILMHYKIKSEFSSKEPFYLKCGHITLPYMEQESSYSIFNGPAGMVFKVEMNEIHKTPEKEGIIERTVASMATGFTGGLDIKKIRSEKKKVAGLSGEEEILQGNDGRKKYVSFDWEYLGTVESGEQPKIQITADTNTENLESKLMTWEKMLNSFRLASQ
jgi:hypothetical protein